jgi:hypothetical protein
VYVNAGHLAKVSAIAGFLRFILINITLILEHELVGPTRDKLKIIKVLRNKREDELNFSEHDISNMLKFKPIIMHTNRYKYL